MNFGVCLQKFSLQDLAYRLNYKVSDEFRSLLAKVYLTGFSLQAEL